LSSNVQQQKIFGLTYIQALGAFAAVIGIVAAFLTWVSATVLGISLSYSGIDAMPNPQGYINGGGIFTILLSLMALGVIFSDKLQKMTANGSSEGNIIAMIKKWSNVFVVIFAGAILLIAANNISQISSGQRALASLGFTSLGSISAGPGLYLTVVAGLGMIFSGLWGLKLQSDHSRMASRQPQAQYQPQSQPQYQTQSQPQYQPAFNSPQQLDQAVPQPAQAPQFCGNCGTATTGAAFCMKCGNKLK
jgi:hypothetical protein